MNVLVATNETLDETAYEAAEGELVMFSAVSFGNGCRSGKNDQRTRKMIGMETHNETTTVKVIDTDITEDLFVEHLLISLDRASLLDYDSTEDMAERAMEHMRELLNVAATFPIGAVLEIQHGGPMIAWTLPQLRLVVPSDNTR